MRSHPVQQPADDSARLDSRLPSVDSLHRSNWAIHLMALAAAALLITAHVADAGGDDAPPPERPWPGDPILYELEVFTPTGDVLFSPRLVGEAGRPALIELFGQSGREGCPSPGLRVSLDALAARGGLDMSMELTVGGLIESHRLRLRMPMNEDQTLWLPTDDGQSLGMTLRAYKVGSLAFEAYLEARERMAAVALMPEA